MGKKEEVLETTAPETVAATIAEQKLEALVKAMEAEKVNGIQVAEKSSTRNILTGNFLIEGQIVPMFVVLDNSVYSYIQVNIADVNAEQAKLCLKHLNELNERYTMLKYAVNPNNTIILTCSIPAANDKFDPALVIALIDQVKGQVTDEYAKLMKIIWNA